MSTTMTLQHAPLHYEFKYYKGAIQKTSSSSAFWWQQDSSITDWATHRHTYVLGRIIQDQTTSMVRYVLCLASLHTFVIKRVDLNNPPARNELDINRLLLSIDSSHGFYPRLERVHIDRAHNRLYMMFEHVAGKDAYWQFIPPIRPSITELCGTSRVMRVLRVCMHVLHAVRDLHSLGISHNDLSMENIMVTPHDDDDGKSLVRCSSHHTDDIRIIDFANATLHHKNKPDDAMYAKRFIECGKENLKSPEQWSANRESFEAFSNDMYCMGYVMFQLMFIAVPFQHEAKMDNPSYVYFIHRTHWQEYNKIVCDEFCNLIRDLLRPNGFSGLDPSPSSSSGSSSSTTTTTITTHHTSAFSRPSAQQAIDRMHVVMDRMHARASAWAPVQKYRRIHGNKRKHSM